MAYDHNVNLTHDWNIFSSIFYDIFVRVVRDIIESIATISKGLYMPLKD
jgi:hypothetical protein